MNHAVNSPRTAACPFEWMITHLHQAACDAQPHSLLDVMEAAGVEAVPVKLLKAWQEFAGHAETLFDLAADLERELRALAEARRKDAPSGAQAQAQG